MSSDDANDDEFQLINEFENLNNEEIMDKDNDDDIDVGEEENDALKITQMKKEELKLEENAKKIKEEFNNINNLKKELQLKLNEQNELIEKNQQTLNVLKQQSIEYNQLSINMKKEIENLKNLRLSIEEEKKKFKSDFEKFENEKKEYEKSYNELKNVITKLNDNKIEVHSFKNENDLHQQLNQLLTINNHNDQIQQEITRLRQLRQQQQDLINQAKLQIESLQSTHNANLLTKLDVLQAYGCKDCGTHIALETDVESRCYQVGQGAFAEKKRGYLFKNAYNVILGATKVENFTTGAYTIAWTSCVKCQQQIGWKYISTDNPNNTSKVGKYCLARYSLISPQDSKDKDSTTTDSTTLTTTVNTSTTVNSNCDNNDVY